MQKGEIWILKGEHDKYAPEVKILEVFQMSIGKSREMIRVKPVKKYSKEYVSTMSVKEFAANYSKKQGRKRNGRI